MAKITCSIGSKSSGSGTSPNVKSEIGNIHVWLVVCMYMCISVQIAKVYIVSGLSKHYNSSCVILAIPLAGAELILVISLAGAELIQPLH